MIGEVTISRYAARGALVASAVLVDTLNPVLEAQGQIRNVVNHDFFSNISINNKSFQYLNIRQCRTSAIEAPDCDIFNSTMKLLTAPSCKDSSFSVDKTGKGE